MRAQNRMLRCALLFATTALTTLAHAQGVGAAVANVDLGDAVGA